jgi:hypothetical protein
MFYQYAFFKPLVNRKLKKPATIRQFIPPLFVLFLLIGWSSCFISYEAFLLYIGGALTYCLANLVFTVKSAWQNKKGYLLFYLPWIFFLQHMTYGIGYLIGIVNFVLLKNSPGVIRSSR